MIVPLRLTRLTDLAKNHSSKLVHILQLHDFDVCIPTRSLFEGQFGVISSCVLSDCGSQERGGRRQEEGSLRTAALQIVTEVAIERMALGPRPAAQPAAAPGQRAPETKRSRNSMKTKIKGEQQLHE